MARVKAKTVIIKVKVVRTNDYGFRLIMDSDYPGVRAEVSLDFDQFRRLGAFLSLALKQNNPSDIAIDL